MRTRAVVASICASVGVLVIGWQVGSAATQQGSTSTATGGSQGSAASTGTYTGSDINTRFGSVQVQLTVSNGVVTNVTALQLTDNDGRSRQISNRAAPILASEVIASQSANVQNVSGATYTTDAYLQSVQSALDQAGL